MSVLNSVRGVLGLKLAAPLDAEPPAGKFELLGARCVGTVSDRWSPLSRPMTIEVESAQRHVVKTLSVPPTRRGHYEFGFEIAPGMDPKAFLSEGLRLFATNAFGLRGRLALDGGSQLALIREHIGKPRDVVFDLDFTRGGNAQSYMVEGWSGPEATLTCSDGKRSVLQLPAPLRKTERYELTMTCFPFLFPPRIADQRMVLTLNGCVHNASRDARSLEFVSFACPAGSLEDAESALLEFAFPDCTRPKDLNINQDSRLLAYGFKRIVLARLLNVVA